MLSLHTPLQALDWLRSLGVRALRPDSRQVRVGDGFIAWPGAATDGRLHVRAALAQGAAACLVEAEGVAPLADWPATAPVAAVKGLKAITGEIAALWQGQPSEALDVLAVTGTNGKTSTVWWLSQALSQLPAPWTMPCAMVGTLGTGPSPSPGATDLLNGLVGTGMTTPDPVLLQQEFRRFVDFGQKACAIEASSIGIAEHRLAGTRIRVALFTNFTLDHLDYHGTMEAYWAAKARLFRWPGLKAAVINLDDPRGHELLALLPPDVQVWTTSLSAPASLQANNIQITSRGLSFDVCEGDACHRMDTALIGHYNVSNLLGVMASLRAMAVPLEQIVLVCASLPPVPGRMQCVVAAEQPLAVVDYAHTPDGLEKALQALRPLAQVRGGRLWCIFGCGGDRDASKRPVMAAVAENNADVILVTNDNPRSEKPRHIVEQILTGLRRRSSVQVELDRGAAIQQALRQAAPADVVLVAGKGHETYQEIEGVKHPFSDVAAVRAVLGDSGGRP
jgi:UDP-N-acetylmuramoyl-L-alanyl-D-glutamate--2,6-diaminopimelate ligase